MKSTFQATLLMFAGVAMGAATPEEAQAITMADWNCRKNECMAANADERYCNDRAKG